MPNRDSSVTYAIALKIAFHVSDMLPPARSLRTNRTRKSLTSHGASKWPRTPLLSQSPNAQGLAPCKETPLTAKPRTLCIREGVLPVQARLYSVRLLRLFGWVLLASFSVFLLLLFEFRKFLLLLRRQNVVNLGMGGLMDLLHLVALLLLA